MKSAAFAQALMTGFSIIGFSLTSSALAASCMLTGNSQDVNDISKSCEALLETMDASDIKQQAFNQCCKSANSYLKENPIPCSDNAKTLYRIKLGLAVCDSIKDPALDYEHQYCVTQMLYHIRDPKVLAIADKCSPTGGRAVGNRRGPKAADPKTADAAAATNERQAVSGEHSLAKEAEKSTEKPNDLHMDDEDFSKCQRARLAEYAEKLDLEVKRAPANQTACEQISSK